MQTWLSGKKTYLVAALAILGAIVAYANGNMDLTQAISAIVAAILACTMRAGVMKSAGEPPA